MMSKKVINNKSEAAECMKEVLLARLDPDADQDDELVEALEQWMEENEWSTLSEMRGNMGVDRAPNPKAYDRANYMIMLQGWERDS